MAYRVVIVDDSLAMVGSAKEIISELVNVICRSVPSRLKSPAYFHVGSLGVIPAEDLSRSPNPMVLIMSAHWPDKNAAGRDWRSP